jgi:hypothetical protein
VSLRRIRQFLMLALFGAALAALSATATLAAGTNPYPCKPGCYCPPAGTSSGSYTAPAAGPNGSANYGGIYGAQENRGNAIRLRERAYSRQMHKQNDNGPGMTCFDHAMALTTRLGNIFSDNVPTSPIPGNNLRAFGVSTYPNYGSDQWMATAMDVVVYPSLSAHAINFRPDSLSDFLGATSFPWWGTFTGWLNGLIGQIMGWLGQIQTYINTLNTLYGYYQMVVSLLNGAIPAWVAAFVATINAAWTAITNFITSNINAVMSTISGFVSNIMSQIMGALGSMFDFANEAGPSPQDECARIQNLWGVGSGFPTAFQTGPLRALSGTGLQTGAPYFNFAQLLTKTPTGTFSFPGAASDLREELSLALPAINNDLVQRAVNDLAGGGPLDQPGNIPVWPTIPAGVVLSPTSTTAAIIGAM